MLKYFRLNPDVYFVQGVAGSVLYDVGRRRLKWLSPADAVALRTCASGVDEATDAPETEIADALVAEQYGRHFANPVFVSPYVAAASLGRSGFNDEPATIRSAYVQLGAACQKGCPGCRPGVTVWQGCNGCAVWPDVEEGSQLSPAQCNEIVVELLELQARSVFFSAGNPAEQADLLLAMIRALREGSHTVNIVTIGSTDLLTNAFVRDLGRNRAKLNCVVSSEATVVSDEIERVGTLLRACKGANVPCYVTVQTLTEPEETATLTKELAALGCDRVLHCRTVCDTPTASGLLPPENRGPSRLRPPGATEMFLRLRHSPCSGIIAIGSDGTIRPCPMIPSVIGHVRDRGIHRVFASSAQNKFWNMTKNRLQGCADCEYRYACVDCLAVDLRASERCRSSICGYDPGTARWHTGDTPMPNWQTRPQRS